MSPSIDLEVYHNGYLRARYGVPEAPSVGDTLVYEDHTTKYKHQDALVKQSTVVKRTWNILNGRRVCLVDVEDVI